MRSLLGCSAAEDKLEPVHAFGKVGGKSLLHEKFNSWGHANIRNLDFLRRVALSVQIPNNYNCPERILQLLLPKSQVPTDRYIAPALPLNPTPYIAC